MRFGRAHRVLFDAFAALSTSSLLAAVTLPRGVAVVAGAALLGAVAVPERWREKRSAMVLWPLSVGAAVALTVLRARGDTPGVALVVEALTMIAIARIATRRGSSTDLQIATLSVAQLFAGALLGGGAVYLACLAACAVVAPAALAVSHLRREVESNFSAGAKDRAGQAVDVPRILRSQRVIGLAFLIAALLTAVPIAGASVAVVVGRLLLSGDLSASAFAQDLTTDRDGPQRDEATPVARVTPSDFATDRPAHAGMYLRAATFDSYDGHSWSGRNAEDGSGEITAPRSDALRIQVEPTEPPTVLVSERAVTPSPVPLDEAQREALLTTPPLPARVATLAHELAAGAESPFEKAMALERGVRARTRYARSSPSRAAAIPLDHFLFESRRGHCEHSATALAVLLRYEGIPSRAVVGFVGGRYNPFGGYYTFRRGDAHAWVDAYVDGSWVRLDATPSDDAAPSSVARALSFADDLFDASQSLRRNHAADTGVGRHVRELARAAARFVLPRDETAFATVTAAGIALAGFVAWALRGRLRVAAKAVMGARRASRRSPNSLYASLDAAMLSLGIPRTPATPPLAHAEALVREGHAKGGEILSLTLRYLDARFGGNAMGDVERREYERRVKGLSAHQGAHRAATDRHV